VPFHHGADPGKKKDNGMAKSQLTEIVQTKIYFIRGDKVMLDADIAEIYGVETKRINEAVRNNPEKFPGDFYFELSPDEQDSLRSNFSTLKKGRGRHSKYPPKAFTEQGVYILETILKNPVASQVYLAGLRDQANKCGIHPHGTARG
jgi:hypothetical protein